MRSRGDGSADLRSVPLPGVDAPGRTFQSYFLRLSLNVSCGVYIRPNWSSSAMFVEGG